MDNHVLLMIMAYVKQWKNYEKRRRNVLIHIINAIKRRNQCVQTILQLINEFQLMNASPNARIRSCRRLPRNKGWWETVSRQYCDKRFKKKFRVSKETFYFLVEKLQICKKRYDSRRSDISWPLRCADWGAVLITTLYRRCLELQNQQFARSFRKYVQH